MNQISILSFLRFSEDQNMIIFYNMSPFFEKKGKTVKKKKLFLTSHSCIGTASGCISTSNTMSQTPPSYPLCFPGMDHPGHPAVPCYDTKFAYRTSALHHWDRCCIKDGEEECECAVYFFHNVTIAMPHAFLSFRAFSSRSCD